MPRHRRKPPNRVYTPLLLALAFLMPTAQSAGQEARFTIDVKLGDAQPDRLEVALDCFQGDDRVLGVEIPPGESRTLSIAVPEARELRCLVGALPIPGQTLEFRGDGGSKVEISADGCLYTGVKAGHSNFCQIEVEQQQTGITVYKKWIGSTDPEPDVEIHLFCGGQRRETPRQLNQGAPAGWELQVSDPEGFVCEVKEIEREEFRADMSDCRDLIIRPGAQEECTMVNTKVVKMIQMLNRYGLFIMIGVFMIAGMIASRRMMP